MKEWKYLIGSADDFIGAPEWATIKSQLSNGLSFAEAHQKGCKVVDVSDGQTYEINCEPPYDVEIIAQRTESFGNAIDLEFCKANPDHPDCKCKAGFLNDAFEKSRDDMVGAIADVIRGAYETYTINIEEPKMADTNMSTLTYKVSLDLSEMDAEVSKNYYNKRAAYLAKKNKYARICKGIPVDVYDVLQAFSVTNPATQHAIKKLLCAGLRGHKDKMQDLTEALKSIERAIELEKS